MAKLNRDIEKAIKEYQSETRKGLEKGVSGNNVWEESDLAAKAGTPLVDSGTGKKVIIRKFEFEWKKGMSAEEKMNAQYNKQDFFNSHAKYIKDFLWKDGLSVLENQDPKMIFNNKGYIIAVATEAKFGASIFEKAMTLQDVMKPLAMQNLNKNKK